MEKKTEIFIDHSMSESMQEKNFLTDALNRVRRDSQLACANVLINTLDAMSQGLCSMPESMHSQIDLADLGRDVYNMIREYKQRFGIECTGIKEIEISGDQDRYELTVRLGK